jgi:hypothetical protein
VFRLFRLRELLGKTDCRLPGWLPRRNVIWKVDGLPWVSWSSVTMCDAPYGMRRGFPKAPRSGALPDASADCVAVHSAIGDYAGGVAGHVKAATRSEPRDLVSQEVLAVWRPGRTNSRTEAHAQLAPTCDSSSSTGVPNGVRRYSRMPFCATRKRGSDPDPTRCGEGFQKRPGAAHSQMLPPTVSRCPQRSASTREELLGM